MATAEMSIGTIFGIFHREETSRPLSSKGWLRPGHELVENAPYQKLELGGLPSSAWP